MLRVISLFLLLIISHVSFADIIIAPTVKNYSMSSSGTPYFATAELACKSISTASSVFSSVSSNSLSCSFYQKKDGQLVSVLYKSVYPVYLSNCPSGYTISNSAGKPDISGQFCSKSACSDAAGTSYSLWVSATNAPATGCYAGCTVAANVVASFPNSTAVYQLKTYTMKDEACPASNIDYVDPATAEAANASAAKAKALEDAKAACGSAGYNIGTANGETVVTCKAPDSPPPSTDTGSNTGTDSASSGMGTDAGSPESNTSGTQNSTVGGGTGSLGGSGYGQGGTSGGGTDSGGTSGSGTDSGGTSGGDTGSGGSSGGGTDSGGTSGSGTDSGSTSGSGTDSGSTSGGDTGSGGSSGSGTGSGTGSVDGSGSGAASGASPTNQTSASDSTCSEVSGSVACATMDSPTADDLPSTEAAWGFTQQSAFGGLDNASCPAALTVMPGVEFSFDNVCSFFERMRPFVIGIAWLIAAYIATGSRNTSGGDD